MAARAARFRPEVLTRMGSMQLLGPLKIGPADAAKGAGQTIGTLWLCQNSYENGHL